VYHAGAVGNKSCDETLYATAYVNFAGKSPFSNKAREVPK
jgi:hypothetical protein